MSHEPDTTEQTGAIGHDRRWSDCETCSNHWRDNSAAIMHACASVGIEHGLTTNQAIAAYFREWHREHSEVAA